MSVLIAPDSEIAGAANVTCDVCGCHLFIGPGADDVQLVRLTVQHERSCREGAPSAALPFDGLRFGFVPTQRRAS